MATMSVCLGPLFCSIADSVNLQLDIPTVVSKAKVVVQQKRQSKHG